MIVRRMREAAAQHNWFGVTVDLVILIAGVFLGIQVNNWNQDRLDRKAGDEYRQRILSDIDSNQVDLANRLTYFRDIKGFAAATLGALDRPVGDEPQAFLVNAYQASQISPRRMRRFTYDEALATGQLKNIGDAALRKRLSSYYTGADTSEVTWQNVTPYREQIRTGMPVAAQEAVRAQCAEKLVTAADGQVLTELPEKCTIRMDADEAALHAAAVRAIPTLRADLIRLMADLDVKIGLLMFFQSRILEVRDQLAAAR